MAVGSILGTSPVGAFVESSAGIAVGGRTGLTAVFVAIFFLISMIFSPLLGVFTVQVTAPALIIVGVLMAQNTAHIHWNKRGKEVTPMMWLLFVIFLIFLWVLNF